MFRDICDVQITKEWSIVKTKQHLSRSKQIVDKGFTNI